MIEITFDGKWVQVKTLEYTIDKSTIDDVPPLLDLGIAEQTLTLNVYYYQLMWLANMVYPQNPKKAKRIRNLAAQHNMGAKLMIDVSECYRIAGRPPVYVLALEYGTGKRVLVRGVAPKDYILYIKHHIIDRATMKTIAELEGLPDYQTKGVTFRFNSTSKIEELDIKKLVPDWEKYHPSYSINDIDLILKQPRI